MLVVLLGLLGITLLFKTENTSLSLSALGGFLIALGAWIRLESLLFLFCLTAGSLIVYKNKLFSSAKKHLVFIGTGCIVILGFFIFNEIRYGHFLGTRFISNQGDYFTSWTKKILQITTILFFGENKIGFYGYTPIFLLNILIMPNIYSRSETQSDDKVLNLATSFFILIVPFAAPNDGVVSWGARYLSLAILPSMILLSSALKMIEIKKEFYRKIAYSIGVFFIIVSLVFTFLGFSIMKAANRQLKEHAEEFQKKEADVYLFQNPLIASMAGTLYFEKKMILAEYPDQLDRMKEILDQHKELRKIALIEHRNHEARDQIIKKQGFDDPIAYLDHYHQFLNSNYKFVLKEESKNTTITLFERK